MNDHGREARGMAITRHHVRSAAEAAVWAAQAHMPAGSSAPIDLDSAVAALPTTDPQFHALSITRVLRARLDASLGPLVEAALLDALPHLAAAGEPGGDPSVDADATAILARRFAESETVAALAAAAAADTAAAVARVRFELAAAGGRASPHPPGTGLVLPARRGSSASPSLASESDASSDFTSARSMASCFSLGPLMPYDELEPLTALLAALADHPGSLPGERHLAALSKLESFAPNDLLAAPCWPNLISALDAVLASADLAYAHRGLGLVARLWPGAERSQRSSLFEGVAKAAARVLRSHHEPILLSDLAATLVRHARRGLDSPQQAPSLPLLFLLACVHLVLQLAVTMPDALPGHMPLASELEQVLASFVFLLRSSNPDADVRGDDLLALLDPKASWLRAWRSVLPTADALAQSAASLQPWLDTLVGRLGDSSRLDGLPRHGLVSLAELRLAYDASVLSELATSVRTRCLCGSGPEALTVLARSLAHAISAPTSFAAQVVSQALGNVVCALPPSDVVQDESSWIVPLLAALETCSRPSARNVIALPLAAAVRAHSKLPERVMDSLWAVPAVEPLTHALLSAEGGEAHVARVSHWLATAELNSIWIDRVWVASGLSASLCAALATESARSARSLVADAAAATTTAAFTRQIAAATLATPSFSPAGGSSSDGPQIHGELWAALKAWISAPVLAAELVARGVDATLVTLADSFPKRGR
ncbi:uncharacterized protein AMSG_02765 [Thecamonas trahens ATCC 50062]|uniref:Uncharacterized protein n=1 Tax=Thecamonas trahens ATCC 50062 TaxID=461836 RepID=A0A0L0D1S7_THETB|nr:hypothetical protein AMSG_02765 [Thecamonas trahens ATCC 50062]KNC46314.1 hypothetical protein AMSG_02765 [Thecamonas trahens ATCC 50062]|eukprot:XP_013760607.1 hypothetical protein AMSG_02765 [Thecamonas trahens ATCC 50062]